MPSLSLCTFLDSPSHSHIQFTVDGIDVSSKEHIFTNTQLPRIYLSCLKRIPLFVFMYLSFFLTYSTPSFPPPSIVYSPVHRTETIRERNEHSERTCLPPLCSHLIIWSRAMRCECVCSQNADRQLEFRLAANVNCLIVYKYFNTKLTNFYTSFSRCIQINILNYML